jgi:flavin reductase (DIM6/NTAB) family NADH-FMN oxidoreductase RutF
MSENLAKIFIQIMHGVNVIGITDGDQQNAFTAAWVMQASFNPPLLVFSINPENRSFQLLKEGGICSINVLDCEQMELADHFGRHSDTDKMSACLWQKAKTGAPVMTESLAYFDCEVSHYADAGDHKLAVCRVVDAAIMNDGCPMSYDMTDDMDGSSDIFPDEL